MGKTNASLFSCHLNTCNNGLSSTDLLVEQLLTQTETMITPASMEFQPNSSCHMEMQRSQLVLWPKRLHLKRILPQAARSLPSLHVWKGQRQLWQHTPLYHKRHQETKWDLTVTMRHASSHTDSSSAGRGNILSEYSHHCWHSTDRCQSSTNYCLCVVTPYWQPSLAYVICLKIFLDLKYFF